jgi:hypothetical protein
MAVWCFGNLKGQDEALSVQERELTGKARAEIAEIWGWLKRRDIF